jgi:tRNA/rRNA methyltransferase
MKGLSVTLVEPEYPVNVGYVARLLKNFGIKNLYLVNPKVDLSVASIYASHGSDILDAAQTLDFKEIRRRHELLIATTSVRARRKGNVVRRSLAAADAAALARAAKSATLVLGRDTTGLTNEEIKLCDVVTTLDTGAEYNTMNVSHAAAIFLYLVSRRNRLTTRVTSRAAREVFARSLYELAVASGFADQKRSGLRESVKRVSATSQLTDRETFLVTGILRKARFAIARGSVKPSRRRKRRA